MGTLKDAYDTVKEAEEDPEADPEDMFIPEGTEETVHKLRPSILETHGTYVSETIETNRKMRDFTTLISGAILAYFYSLYGVVGFAIAFIVLHLLNYTVWYLDNKGDLN